MSATKETRTSRYKAVLKAATAPMTVREICAKAGIPAEEAKFVSSGLVREVKEGRVRTVGRVACPITSRQSEGYAYVGIEEPAATVEPVSAPITDDPKAKKKKSTSKVVNLLTARAV